MTLRHLEIFVDVVDSGKMTTTAEKLYISQSSVSQAIADIEAEYQVKLFERLNKRLYITEQGKELLKYARGILSLHKDMEDYMRNSKPTIRIGATFTIAATLLSPLIHKLNENLPGVKTAVEVERTNILEERLLRNQLDVAYVEGVLKSDDLIAETIQTDELLLVCPPSHPFYCRESVYMHELEGQPFVQREEGSQTRNLFERQLQKYNVQVETKWVCNNMEAIKSAAVGGQGLAIMSGRLVQSEVKAGQLKVLRIEDVSLERKFVLAYHKNKFISPELEAFKKCCHALSADELPLIKKWS